MRYGDLAPRHDASLVHFIVIAEIAASVFFVVVLLARFISLSTDPQRTRGSSRLAQHTRHASIAFGTRHHEVSNLTLRS
jgi:hypothetical protein